MKAILLIVAFAILPGCAGKATADSSAVLCSSLTQEHESALVAAAEEWNTRAGTEFTVVRGDCQYLTTPHLVVSVVEATAEDIDGLAGRVWLEPGAGLNQLSLRGDYDIDRIRRTALHELGHALGIHHSPEPSDIMFWKENPTEHLTEHDLQLYLAERPWATLPTNGAP